MRIGVPVILILTACGGGSSGGPVAPEQLAGALARSTCTKLSACCTAQEFMSQTLSSNVSQCEAVFTGLIGTQFVGALQSSIAAGRVIYHADRMGECLAAIDAASCTEYQRLEISTIGACEDPFEGLVAIGGACADDFDCVSEYCSGDSIDMNGTITFGVCANAAIGQPCDNSNCVPGAFCDSSGTCAAPQADGASCGNKEECASGACNGSTCGVPTTCDGN